MTRGARPAIVVVAHLCPFPTIHGNRARLVALLEWLRSKGFHVTYILQPLDVDGTAGIPRLAEAVDRLEVVPSPHVAGVKALSFRQICGRLARTLLPGAVADGLRNVLRRTRPLEPSVRETWGSGDVGGDGHIDRWCWPATCRAVHRAIRRDGAIAVVAEYALLSKCLEGVPPSALKVIDTVEVFFRNRERFQVEGLAAPFVCTAESERAALNRADLLVAIQKNDAQALKALFPGKRVITVPYAYSRRRPRSGSPDRGTILYVGSSNPFNVHGLQQFLDQTWRTILSRVPDATLRVVGSVPRMPGADARQVIHVGRVSNEELAREYQTAHVVINPQVAGTGLKIKCVEALSAGCPIVMNQAGADGLEEGGGHAFLVAGDWQEFASQVVRILTDDAVRRGLEAEARRFADKMFSPDVTFSELERALGQHARSAGHFAS